MPYNSTRHKIRDNGPESMAMVQAYFKMRQIPDGWAERRNQYEEDITCFANMYVKELSPKACARFESSSARGGALVIRLDLCINLLDLLFDESVFGDSARPKESGEPSKLEPSIKDLFKVVAGLDESYKIAAYAIATMASAMTGDGAFTRLCGDNSDTTRTHMAALGRLRSIYNTSRKLQGGYEGVEMLVPAMKSISKCAHLLADLACLEEDRKFLNRILGKLLKGIPEPKRLKNEEHKVTGRTYRLYRDAHNSTQDAIDRLEELYEPGTRLGAGMRHSIE